MLRRTQITVTSLTAYRVPDKLAREGIPVLSVRKTQKNGITFEVASKDRKKVFAILRGSCYNVEKIRFRAFSAFAELCVRSAGLLVGAALFLLLVLGAQTRVLKIEVVGNGAFYEAEVMSVLERGGVKHFSAAPKETGALCAEILSLPRVSYCSIAAKGGVVTVEVRVSDENALLESVPLLSPATGVVEELVVVRGTARVSVGDRVEKGAAIVDCAALYGETERRVVVIARVKISFPVAQEYGGSEADARASAYLEFGEISDIKVEQTEKGWLVTGTGYAEGAVNLD